MAIHKGYYECDYCNYGGRNDAGEFYTETGNHVACQDMAELRKLYNQVVEERDEAVEAAEELANRLEYHQYGTTHYVGCENDHPDCRVLKNFRVWKGKHGQAPLQTTPKA